MHALGLIGAGKIARVHAGLRRPDATMVWLEKAARGQEEDLDFLRVDPTWDFIRTTPRFAELVRRIGVPDRPSVVR